VSINGAEIQAYEAMWRAQLVQLLHLSQPAMLPAHPTLNATAVTRQRSLAPTDSKPASQSVIDDNAVSASTVCVFAARRLRCSRIHDRHR